MTVGAVSFIETPCRSRTADLWSCRNCRCAKLPLIKYTDGTYTLTSGGDSKWEIISGRFMGRATSAYRPGRTRTFQQQLICVPLLYEELDFSLYLGGTPIIFVRHQMRPIFIPITIVYGLYGMLFDE